MMQAKKESFSGHALELGRQDIWIDADELAEVARQCGFDLKYSSSPQLINSQFLSGKDVVNDVHFFKSLGFHEVSSLDGSDFEDATFIHDLNRTPVPDHLKERFDVIYELGTMEHIFHLPNVLSNIHTMLKVGGYVVHGSPCSNAFQHGFYMFSPCFFFDYYQANRYDVVGSWLMRYRVNGSRELTTCEVMECWPDSPGLNALSYIGSLDARYYAFNIVVRKNATSISGIAPQQGYYNKIWVKVGEEQRRASADTPSIKRRLVSLLSKMPLLQVVARSLYFRWRRWNSLNWNWKRIPN
ncbi:MAG TPA: class I SAM-dependent methyltransferase [Nitrospira sp.]|nr:class I SAM-dependent methyltransferase [Nitrospira sp.]